MTTPTPGDVKSRTLRTLAQNLAFDVLLAVIVVVLPLVQAATVDWRIVAASVLKTAMVTALAGVQRVLESRRV
jgi:hypothetical protein